MKKTMKFGVCFLVCCSLLGCSATKVEEKQKNVTKDSIEDKNDNAYADIPEESIMTISSMVDIDINISDSNVMYEMSDYLVLARVDSIEGGSNISLKTGEYVHPYTYGKMTILEVYKGEIQKGYQLDYVRMGGIITFDEYLNGLYPNQREKILTNMTEKPEYVKQMFGEDIDIEVGVNYLVYLTGTETQVARPGSYMVIGWQGGLRAISGDVKMKSGIKVYNNITGQWEVLENVIPSH